MTRIEAPGKPNLRAALLLVGDTLLCPQCEDCCTHVDVAWAVGPGGGSHLHATGEDGGAMVTTSALGPGGMSRRHIVGFAVRCEQGCFTTIELGQHKGITQVFITATDPPGPDEPGFESES
jgi:hypothetical protein